MMPRVHEQRRFSSRSVCVCVCVSFAMNKSFRDGDGEGLRMSYERVYNLENLSRLLMVMSVRDASDSRSGHNIRAFLVRYCWRLTTAVLVAATIMHAHT